MSEISFDVEAVEGPELVGEGQPAPSPADSPEAPVAALPGWTPAEASQLVASLCTAGFLITFLVRRLRLPGVPEWPHLAAAPGEFPMTGHGLVPLLDRWLPKDSAGGLAIVGVGLLACAGEVGVAVARRAPLLGREAPRPFPHVVETPPPPAPASPAAQGEPPAPAPVGQPTGYRLDADLVRVIPLERDDSLRGIGV